MTRAVLPPVLAELADRLAAVPSVVAVVLGGSRAAGTERPDSDWDIGLYYRGGLDLAGVRALGHPGYVSELGEWGPFMNGGAWLTLGDLPVDVLFRDLDRVERWLEAAEQGRYEVLMQNGYLAGAPTYVAAAELALCRPVSGDLPRPAFPPALAEAASRRWHGRAAVSLMFAELYAERADLACCTGMLVDASLCVAHARLAGRREWVTNEKGLIERADLTGVQPLLAQASSDLAAAVAAVSAMLGVEPLSAR